MDGTHVSQEFCSMNVDSMYSCVVLHGEEAVKCLCSFSFIYINVKVEKIYTIIN